MRKTRKGHKKVTRRFALTQREMDARRPSTPHAKWADFMEKVRGELGWTLEEMCSKTDVEIGWLKKARKGLAVRGKLRIAFERRVCEGWKARFPNKPALEFPAWVSDAPWSGIDARTERPAKHQPLDDKLLTDPLVGISFADTRTQVEWDFAFDHHRQWLRVINPEDTYRRAHLVWSTLLKGSPDQILDVIRDAAAWLQSGPTERLEDRIEPRGEYWSTRRELWFQRITGIFGASIERPNYQRTVLEDTLVREALLRWLKSDGMNSPLASRIRSISEQGISSDIKSIFVKAVRECEENWGPIAVREVYDWISGEHDRGLAKVCLIWLTGRNGMPRSQIPSVIRLATDWLDNHPDTDDTLVRWGVIWLAGMFEGSEFTKPLLERTRSWLRSPASEDDRLVRWAYLWLIGEQGSREEMESAIAETTEWLSDSRNCKDTCIRLGLLFSIRRAVPRKVATPKQLEMAVDDMRPWLGNDPLIELGVALARCVQT